MEQLVYNVLTLNSSPPGQNGRLFAEDSLKTHFLEWKFYISVPISLKLVPGGPIDNIAALGHLMSWRQTRNVIQIGGGDFDIWPG